MSSGNAQNAEPVSGVRVIVCGGRDYWEAQIVWKALDDLPRIQAENHAKITEVARVTWRAFVTDVSSASDKQD